MSKLKKGEKILFGVFGAFFVLAVIGYIALETVRYNSTKPMYENKTHFNLSEVGLRGSTLFREARCTSCHRAMRNGTNMGLSLDGVGSRRKLEWIKAFFRTPEEVYKVQTVDHGSPPKEAAYVTDLPLQDRDAIAVFLSELRSEQGSPSAQRPPEGRSAFIDNMVQMWAPESWKDKYKDIRTQPNIPKDEAGHE